jgi:hypothetical protein
MEGERESCALCGTNEDVERNTTSSLVPLADFV